MRILEANMDSEVEKFSEAFESVKKLGFIKTKRVGNTGIGKTLEDFIGVTENNIDAPDLHGFEIKSQRALSTSFVTLFTRAPTFPKAANNTLRLKFGSYDKEFPDIKVLHVSLFANRWTNHSAGFAFKLDSQLDKKQLHLQIRDVASETMIDEKIYWEYAVFEKIMNEKIQRLAFVEAQNKKINDEEYFHFEKCTLYYGVSLEKFIQFINSGDIMFDIRIGAYKNKSSRSYGKTHDHGSGFRIKKDKLDSLFESKIVI